MYFGHRRRGFGSKERRPIQFLLSRFRSISSNASGECVEKSGDAVWWLFKSLSHYCWAFLLS